MWINLILYIILLQWGSVSHCKGMKRRQQVWLLNIHLHFPLYGHNMLGLINFSQRWNSAHHLRWNNHICMPLGIIPLLLKEAILMWPRHTKKKPPDILPAVDKIGRFFFFPILSQQNRRAEIEARVHLHGMKCKRGELYFAFALSLCQSKSSACFLWSRAQEQLHSMCIFTFYIFSLFHQY